MLEFILDFVFDLIVEGTIFAMSEKKVSMPIRIIAFFIVALLYIGFGGLCIFASVCAWVDNDTISAILFFALGLFIFVGGFIQMRKEIKKRNE